MDNITEATNCLELALRMYGDASVRYARAVGTSDEHGAFDNMAFWQNQVWQCAQARATLSV